MWEGPTTLLSGSCQAACDASGGTTAASSTVASAALPLRCARFGAELWAGEVPETGLECVQTQSCVPTLVCDHLQAVLLSRDGMLCLTERKPSRWIASLILGAKSGWR